MLLPPDAIRTADTVAACSREGAGIGEAFAIVIAVALGVLLLTLVVAAIVGAAVARSRGRPAWKGALLGSGGVLGGLLALALLVFGGQLLHEWAERRERDRVTQWLQPLDALAPGMLATTLDQLLRTAPRYPYVRTRLGYELQQRLLNREMAWSDTDLAAADRYSPAPQDMHGAVLWARHGLPGLHLALADTRMQRADLALLVHTASWRCSYDLPRCRRETRDSVFEQMDDAIAVGIASVPERDDLQRLARNVRQQAFGGDTSPP